MTLFGLAIKIFSLLEGQMGMRDVEFKSLMLLDGYNVIYRLSELTHTQDHSLRERRNALISFMHRWQRDHSYKGKVCIVFDGRDGIFEGSGKSVYGIDCLYSHTKEEADDRILSIIKKHAHPSGIVVISDDNYVRNNCRAYSVDVKAVSFLLEASGPRPRKASDEDAGEKKLDSSTRNAINNALKKEWGIE